MNRLKRHRLFCLACGLALCALASTSRAAGRVQGFEPGDPPVQGVGDAGTQLTYQGEAPPDPTHWYLITTIRSIDNEDGITNQSGNDAVSIATLNNSSNFNGAAPVGTNPDGSGVFIPFTFSAGDLFLTLSYDIVSNQPGLTPTRADPAFYNIFDTSHVAQRSTVTFADSNNAILTFGGQSPFIFHSGIQTLQISLAGLTAGTSYLLGIGVEDQGTGGDHATGVLIDNVQTIVPEPSTVGLVFAGAVLLVACRKRMKLG